MKKKSLNSQTIKLFIKKFDIKTNLLVSMGTSLMIIQNFSAQPNFQEHIIDEEKPKSTQLLNVDFNNDNNTDILVLKAQYRPKSSSTTVDYHKSTQLSWAKNLGNGKFDFLKTLKHVYASNAVVFDYDGDGYTDIVATIWEKNKLVWYKNLQNDIFSAAITIDDLLDEPFALSVLDANNDGKKDLICGTVNFAGSSTTNNKVILYTTDGLGTVTNKSIVTTSNKIYKIHITNLNNDGYDDIVVQHDYPSNEDKIIFLTNNQDLTFSFYHTINNLTNIDEVLITDYDNDNLDDVLYFDESAQLRKYRNTGAGFTSQSATTLNGQSFNFKVFDWDNDGDEDIICLDNASISVYLNTAGSFTPNTLYNYASYSNAQLDLKAFAIADYDNDGIYDLSYRNTSVFGWVKGLGTNQFAPLEMVQSSLEFNSVYPADLDNDGDIDIVTSIDGNTDWTEQGVGWYQNLGNNQFNRFELLIPNTYSTSNLQVGTIRILDYNQDGLPEIFMGDYIYENDGNMNYTPNFTISSIYLPLVLNIDNDTDFDLITSIGNLAYRKNTNGNIQISQDIYDNNGMLVTVPPGFGSYFSQAIDLDGDGKIDIVNGNEWFKNLGNYKFNQLATFVTDPNFNFMQEKMTYKDVDNDGDIDVLSFYRILPDLDNDAVKVYFNDGNMNFNQSAVLVGGIFELREFLYEDIDGDNVNDIVISKVNELAYFKGRGGLNFAPMQVVKYYDMKDSLNSDVFQFYLNDMNNDNKVDLIAHEIFNYTLLYLENIGFECSAKTYEISKIVCNNKPVVFGNRILENEGVYIDTLLASNLCDSIVILTLSYDNTFCEDKYCFELFISEYVEGSGNSEAIEIYNPTKDTIDLSSYKLHIFHELSNIDSSIVLSGLIYPDSTFVVANSASTATLLLLSDQLSTKLDFNGNDAIALSKNNTFIDVIGYINNPGIVQSVTHLLTGSTLVRNDNLLIGTIPPNYDLLSEKFSAYPENTFTYLKNHQSVCAQLICQQRISIDYELCMGDTLSFGNKVYTQAGIYYDTISNQASCDSIVERRIVANQLYSASFDTICFNGSLNLINQTITEAGQYFDTIRTASGCDSIVKLIVYKEAEHSRTETIIACNSYTWVNGQTYTSSTNTPIHILPNAATNGCDSVLKLNLTIRNTVFHNQVQSACGSYTWINGQTYTSNVSGVSHVFQGGASNGCDSVVLLYLTIINPVFATDVQTSCGPFTWINGQTYSTSTNTPTHVIIGGASNGCDSIITLNLTILPSAYGVDIKIRCGSYTWIDGQTYTASTNSPMYTIIGGASSGCDSVVNLNLVIKPIAQGIDTQISCGPFTWINGQTYNSSTNSPTYTIFGGALNACDSIVTLNLTVLSPASGIDTKISCGSYTWIDGQTYNASTSTPIHIIFGGASNGCDSIVTLHLTVNTINAQITENSGILTANVSNASYQWLNCLDNNSPIVGETTQTFEPVANGEYAVVITDNNCIDTSDCFVYSNLRLNENLVTDFNIYPNPNDGNFTIELNSFTPNELIQILDLHGKIIETIKVQSSEIILKLKLMSGMYFIHHKNEIYKIIVNSENRQQ